MNREQMKEIVYVEHEAGDFEDGLQVCVLCGKVITDYTGHWVSNEPNMQIRGFPKGKIYITGTNPVETTTIKPLENYGEDDPYLRKIVRCVD